MDKWSEYWSLMWYYLGMGLFYAFSSLKYAVLMIWAIL